MFHKNEANEFISGIGVHWYWDHVAPSVLLDKTHELYPDKFIISTEACFTKQIWESSVVHLGSWTRGEQYAENIIDVWGIKFYLDKNVTFFLGLESLGCRLGGLESSSR